MNEQDRAEFDRLQQRQSELLGQFIELGRKLSALEARLTAAATPVETPAPKAASAIPPIIPVAPQPPPLPDLEIREVEIPPLEPTPIEPPPMLEPAMQASQTEEFVAQSAASEPTPAPIPLFVRSRATPPKEPISDPLPEKSSSFEMRLGTFWLVRIGIVVFLTGLVFFANYAYQNFIHYIGAPGKVGLLYLVSGGLLAAGAWLQRNPKLKNYAQVLMAGGLAAVYFTTYAAHHVPNLIVIKSATLDGALLLAWAGFIIWQADRRKSEALALFAVLLAYYTAIITHVGLFTLYSNLILTLAAVYFLVRNRWATISFASLVATYIGYGFWRFYQDGHWQFVDPSEGLWMGNYFLMAYWAVFTGAVFLSRNEQFLGNRRTTFLSLNNAAFFSAFIFTMWQVHHHNFWEFSLSYGSVLLVLWVLARLFLAKDKLSQNAYLTQGLLLVTLGFVTHITGMKLSLVLAAESVILVILGQQMKSRVMQAASMLAGLLAVGWGMEFLHPFNREDLIKDAVIGAAMLFNAFWLRNEGERKGNQIPLRTTIFTILALTMWLFTTWNNTHDEWRGVALATEAAVFLLAYRPLGNQVLRYGAGIFAAVAVSWEAYALAEQYQSIELIKRVGLAPGIIVGALMILSAFREKTPKAKDDAEPAFRPIVTFFCSLGLFTWLVTTVVFTPREYLAPLLAGEALVLTASFYALRLKEMALFGQMFLILAQLLWLYDSIDNHATRPWWNPVTVIAITLALAQWWQRQKSMLFQQPLRMVMQGTYALAVVGLLYFWLQPHFVAPAAWLAFSSALAVLLTLYGAINRYWLLAAAGQIFLVVSGVEFVDEFWNGKPDLWYLPLSPIATCCLLSFSAIKWFEARQDARPGIRETVLQLGLVYRVVALVMSLWWVHKYIPAREICWVLAVIGAFLFAVAGWLRNREMLVFSAAFSLTAIMRFWYPMEEAERVYLPNLFALLLVLAQQQFAKRLPGRYQAPLKTQSVAIALGGLSLWFLLSRWIIKQPDEFYMTLTAGWAVLALALFAVAMALRERMYRWLGLTILAGALGRVVFIEVWKLETVYKVLSFMALGLVLFVLGFIYNKYQEKIKEWL